MKKIEMIHNEVVFETLKSLREEGLLDGYTTLSVHRGHGPLKGSYRPDLVQGRQFYTLVVLGDAEAGHFLEALKRELQGVNLAVIVSEVTVPAL